MDWQELTKALSEPFHPMFVEWKPSATTKDGTKALAAAYVDARHYQYRLDILAPGWETEYQFIKPDGSLVKCRLTINGVTREDIGEQEGNDNNTATSAVAQAFKRACAAFGLGRYLYFIPIAWSEYDSKSKRIVSPPQLPAWAKPGGSGYPPTGEQGKGNAQSKQQTSRPPAQASKPQPPAQPQPAQPTGELTYEQACEILNHEGVKYGDIDITTLSNMTKGINAALAKNGITAEQKAEYERKLDAVVLILRTRNGGK